MNSKTKPFYLSRTFKILLALFFLTVISFVTAQKVLAAQDIPIPNISIGAKTSSNPKEVASSLQILVLLTILSLAPALLIMTTCFTRIIVPPRLL